MQYVTCSIQLATPDDDDARLTRPPLFRTTQDYDVHHSKSVTVPQFARAMDLMRLRLTPAELEVVAQRFNRGNEFVDYQAFCDEMDEGTHTCVAARHLKAVMQHSHTQCSSFCLVSVCH